MGNHDRGSPWPPAKAKLKAPHSALFGRVGQVIETNSADDAPGKNSWWTNHQQGSIGPAPAF